MEEDPHQLLEGIAIACHAIRSNTAYLYLRYEYGTQLPRARCGDQRMLRGRHAWARRFWGADFKLDIYLHRGAGAYICGEETGLIESLEGKRAWPRIKPPFPAIEGLFRKPTIVNNVETLCCVTHILAARRRLVQVDRRAARSEQPARPGQLRAEAVLHQRAREQAVLRGVAAGRDGARADRRARRRRVERPQGEGRGAGRHQHGLSVGERARYEARFRRAGQSRLPGLGHGGGRRDRRSDEHGRRALQLLPVHVARIVRPVHALPRRHELDARRFWSEFASGRGKLEDLDLLLEVANSMGIIPGTTICGLSDGAAWPVKNAIMKFRPSLKSTSAAGGRSITPAQELMTASHRVSKESS